MATILKRCDSYCLKYRDLAKKQRWESFKTKKEAERRKVEVEHQLQNDNYVDPRDRKRTVGEAWKSFETTRWSGLRLTTQAFYGSAWRVHIAPRWEHERKRAIGTEAVEGWQAELLTAGIGERTVQSCVSLLGQLFRHALRYRWVDYNPVQVARKTKPKSHIRAWTPDELAAILAKADADEALLVRVAASTGLRFGELAGLRWSDVSFEAARLTVVQQFTKGAFSEPKTDNARRVVPIASEIVKELRLWKLRCPWSEDGLVFPSPDGSALDSSNFHHRVWRPLLKRAGVPHGTFHALRHSFASALINSNQSPKVVQTLLGHHSAAFTMDQYSDLWPQALEGIADTAAATLFSGDASKVVAKSADPEKLEAEVFDLNGGPCRDRTYDQLIKSSFLARALLSFKTSTYVAPVVPRFVDLRNDKALNVLLSGFSNGTVVYRYGTGFVEPPAR
jgi:integrase